LQLPRSRHDPLAHYFDVLDGGIANLAANGRMAASGRQVLNNIKPDPTNIGPWRGLHQLNPR